MIIIIHIGGARGATGEKYYNKSDKREEEPPNWSYLKVLNLVDLEANIYK
eukprot:SAG31_NODE_5523_length_2480_cov_1.317934_3_plen_50_part_00